MRLAIVGVMPFFSILCTAPGDTPACRASSASDHPRSARALATLAPSADTVRSISGSAIGGGVVSDPAAIVSDTTCAPQGTGSLVRVGPRPPALDLPLRRAVRISFTIRYGLRSRSPAGVDAGASEGSQRWR